MGVRCTAVDADLIDSLAPDVIVTQDLCAVCAVSSGELASACPVDVEVLSLDPRTLAEVADTVRLLGSRLGADRRGEELATRMLNTIESVAESVRGLPKRRVFFAEWIDPPFCAGHWLPEMIDLAGGVDVLGCAGQPSHPTSWDTVWALEPELVIVGPCGFDVDQAAARVGELAFAVCGGGGRRRCVLLPAGAEACGRRSSACVPAAPGDRAGPGAAADRAHRWHRGERRLASPWLSHASWWVRRPASRSWGSPTGLMAWVVAAGAR